MQITPPPRHHLSSGRSRPLTRPAADQAAAATAFRSLLVLGASPAPAKLLGPVGAACQAHSGSVLAQLHPRCWLLYCVPYGT